MIMPPEKNIKLTIFQVCLEIMSMVLNGKLDALVSSDWILVEVMTITIPHCLLKISCENILLRYSLVLSLHFYVFIQNIVIVFFSVIYSSENVDFFWVSVGMLSATGELRISIRR